MRLTALTDSTMLADILQQGVIAHQSGQLAQAKAAYEQVLAEQPEHFDALHLLGVVAAQTHHPELAAELIGKAIEINPNVASAYFNHGTVLQELGRLEEALLSYEQAIALKPDYADAFNNRGVVLQELQRPDDALFSCDKAIVLKPDFSQAFYNRGNALKELKRLEEALSSYDKAIAINPDDAEAFNNRGIVLQELKRPEEALSSYDKAIVLKPDYAQAFYNRGSSQKELKRLEEALSSFDKAIALKSDYAEAWNNRGFVLQALKRQEEALSSYDKAIALKAEYAEAFNNRGNALQDLKRLEDALSSYDQAIALKPKYAEAFYNRGLSLQELERPEDALASYDKAIALKPEYAEAFHNRGTVLEELNRSADALSSYDKALTLKPDGEFWLGIKPRMQMHFCDWRDLQNQLKEIEVAIAQKKKATAPFELLGWSYDPELQLKASKIYAEAKYPVSGALGDFNRRPSDGKIRIGYYSADFYNHATSVLIAELLESHDTQKFELYGFSFGPDAQDEMRSRVAKTFHHFVDVRSKTDREVARMSRDLDIDIAVDLKGFTKDCRTGIFAERCAPIQVNYLGYPGTLAAPYFDYIVADKTLIPCESQQYYAEKIIYLPHSYQVNDSKRQISPKLFTRQELGLPESGFVFCCFNNNYKILPETFDVWMRLLKAVSASVLWLLQDNPTAAKNLRQEAAIRGIDPSRLIFAPRMVLKDHLARHRVADLFIDTLPCNAHTTASDALWAGLPVLTQAGQSFAGRVAASLLHAMDLPELITQTREEYEARAIELANDPLQLARVKKKVAQNRLSSPLFSGQTFARCMEMAYAEIHKRHLNGEKPDHIDVSML